MGYHTEFRGEIAIEPPLSPEEIEFLNKFANTRRMDRAQGPYHVEGTGFMGQGRDPDIINFNSPPPGQPGLWCHWTSNHDGTALEWDGGEKFYDSAEWMKYLINHFLKPDAIAHSETRLQFLRGHTLNGTIEAQGEDSDDHWYLIVENNKVYTAPVLHEIGTKQEV